MRNYREKGGTGKLKSFWEEAIFEVLEKKEDLPVYKVQNLQKPSDVRVVHRNKIMKCDELPLDTFEDPKQVPVPKKKKAAGAPRKQKQPKQEMEVVQERNDEVYPEESDEETERVVLVEQVGPETRISEVEIVPDDVISIISEDNDEEAEIGNQEELSGGEEHMDEMAGSADELSGAELDETLVGTESAGEHDVSDVTIAYEDADELLRMEADVEEPPEMVVDEVGGLPDADDEVVEPVELSEEGESSEEVEPEDSPVLRRSSRSRVAPKRFTYEEVGGNPTMASVTQVLASLDDCVWLRGKSGS